jgi:hypothetical protein
MWSNEVPAKLHHGMAADHQQVKMDSMTSGLCHGWRRSTIYPWRWSDTLRFPQRHDINMPCCGPSGTSAQEFLTKLIVSAAYWCLVSAGPSQSVQRWKLQDVNLDWPQHKERPCSTRCLKFIPWARWANNGPNKTLKRGTFTCLPSETISFKHLPRIAFQMLVHAQGAKHTANIRVTLQVTPTNGNVES